MDKLTSNGSNIIFNRTNLYKVQIKVCFIIIKYKIYLNDITIEKEMCHQSSNDIRFNTLSFYFKFTYCSVVHRRE
jgi:hypothetical protein